MRICDHRKFASYGHFFKDKMKTYINKDWYEYEYESIDLGEEELVYCKKCRKFFSAFHKDYGSYFCPKCDSRKKEVWKEGAENEIREYAKMLFDKYNKNKTSCYSKS